MMDILKQLSDFGILPTVTFTDSANSVPVAKALATGNLPCAEIAFDTEAAAASVKQILEAVPDMLIGAGSVLTLEQADQAIAAGAEFITSPVLDLELVNHCLSKGVVIIPGCQTLSEIWQAKKCGLKAVKLFPAELSGGVSMIEAFAAVFPDMQFIATGGIQPQTLNNYLDNPHVLGCGAAWLTPAALINSGEFSEITKLVEKTVHLMLGFKTVHVGINCQNREEAAQIADKFEELFGFPKVEYGMSFLSATSMEEMKSPYLGTNGHVAFATNYPVRAVSYLERKGIVFDEATSVFDDIGLKAIYMNGEIGDFAYHLVRTPK